MNYYIDFDSTLYNTSGLVEKMLKALAKEMNRQNSKLNAEQMYLEEKKLFNRDGIYNIFELCKYFAIQYGLNAEDLISAVNGAINNGKDLVYNDSVDFLKSAREKGNKLYMLTYTSQDGLEYQIQKVYGSGLVPFFDNIIITSTPKWQLDLDYTKGIFIDDNPKDLAGLYENKPYAIVRIKRDGNKYATKPMPEGIQLPEYTSLKEIELNTQSNEC